MVRMRNEPALKARYWTPTLMQEWGSSCQVLNHDGISDEAQNLATTSVEQIGIDYILSGMPADVASAVHIINTCSSKVTIISQLPDEGNRWHYHPDVDEWWLILEGQYKFSIGRTVRGAIKGDIIAVPRNTWHQITAVGDKRAVRLAVSREGAAHVYHD